MAEEKGEAPPVVEETSGTGDGESAQESGEVSTLTPDKSKDEELERAHEAAKIADDRFGRTKRGREMLSDYEFGGGVLDFAEKIVELRDKATIDDMTKLLNEAGLNAGIDRLVRSIVGKNESLFVVRADLSNFKMFNDLFGHKVGDDCLKELGKLMRGEGEESAFRVIDVLGREVADDVPGSEGGDEVLAREKGDDFVSAFWITREDRNGSDPILETVGAVGNIVDRFKNIGDSLQQIMQERYGREYSDIIIEAKEKEKVEKKVRKALRLAPGEDIPSDWTDKNIATLTIGGLAINPDRLEQLWDDYIAGKAELTGEESKQSFWKDVLSPRIEEPFEMAKMSDDKGSRFVGKEI